MATKRQLRERWGTPEGKQLMQALSQALRTSREQTTLAQLHLLVDALPYTEEVAPNLDLRGLHLEDHIFLRYLDLPGVRLDYSILYGNLCNGDWSRAAFNEADITGISIHLDLTGAFFIKTDARCAWFTYSILNEANFREAKLIGSYLQNVPCRYSCFRGADMRYANCVSVDFRGADLSGANLTGASLGSVLFDEHTRVQDANFTATALDDEFKTFIINGEAVPPREDVLDAPDEEVAIFDATIVLLQELNRDGSLTILIRKAIEIREIVKETPTYNWDPIIDALPAELAELFYDTYGEGMGVAYYYM